MKRTLTVILFLVFLPAFSLAQEVPSPARLSCLYCRPKDGVVGPVRTVLAVEKRDVSPFDTTAETYGSEGRRVESLVHSSDREIHSGQIVRLDTKVKYIYDREGKLIKEVGSGLEDPNREHDMVSYVYDRNGRLSEETVLHGDKPFIKTLFTYEPEKRTVTALTTTYIEGRIVGPDKAVLVYNDKGQWIKRTIFRSNGSLNAISEFSYDERGNLAKETRYGDNGKYSYASIFTHKYDTRGNWFERHEMNFESEAKKTPDWMVVYRVIAYQIAK
jgi:hypothetical protein